MKRIFFGALLALSISVAFAVDTDVKTGAPVETTGTPVGNAKATTNSQVKVKAKTKNKMGTKSKIKSKAQIRASLT